MSPLPLVLVALVLLLAACGSGAVGGDRATDPAGDAGGQDAGPPPREVPAAPGQVRTRGVVTVLDAGERAELCLGAVAESWPPQCGGPPIEGWSWRRQLEQPGQPGGGVGGLDSTAGTWEQASGVRWGQYALVGRWDGTTFTMTTAVPAAQHVAVTEPEPDRPDPARELSGAELRELSRDLMSRLPGVLVSGAEDGRVLLDVVYDDGTLQDWVDRRYGEGVVVLTPALVDVPDPSAG